MSNRSKKFILEFNEIGMGDVDLVGGKNASLGEMIQKVNVPVPPGFAITAYAYRHFIKESNLNDFIEDTLKGLDTHDVNQLAEVGQKIREAIVAQELPDDLTEAIVEAYDNLRENLGLDEDVDCAVRSSATAEDLPDASFAGQQDTYLHVKGKENILEKAKECIASLFTNRAISYRVDKGFDHMDVALSVGVQMMARTDKGSAGVAFSIDTDTGFPNVVYITGSYGLGEYVVQGKVIPDQYYVFKPTKTIISKKLGEKHVKLVYSREEGVQEVEVPEIERNKFVLSDEQIIKLAEYSMRIEKHYEKPMDIEWGVDGLTNKLFILQARPETVHSQRHNYINVYKLNEKSKALIEGEAVGSRIGQGSVNVILSAENIDQFKKGEVLVTEMTDPDWEPIMKIAGAIVTNRGGRTCHAAIVSRELGIPCIIGTETSTEALKNDQKVTVDCSEGKGIVYDGLLDFEVDKIELDKIPEIDTQIMMNVGIPEKAFILGQYPHKGVGLARLEFIINSHIQIHPTFLLKFDQIKNWVNSDKKDLTPELAEFWEEYGSDKELIELKEYYKGLIDNVQSLTKGYKDKEKYFIDILAEGVGKIAAAFYPHPVIVRLSDFKTNEYANLIGGKYFEPEESNPMIGWRGASRYYSDNFIESFRLECEAIKKVREEMKLKNVKVMIPFCRTPEEGIKVIKTMKKFELEQGKDDLEVYVMCEIPSNVILADEYSEIFDGFSIGSNDLTQLTLGLDRDSEQVQFLFNERHPAVKKMLKTVIDAANKNDKKIGICGQGPSDFPSLAAFLVECGINSMSLNSDVIVQTIGLVKIIEYTMDEGKSYEDLTPEYIKSIPKLDDGLKELAIKMIEKEKNLS
ncbi:MAG: phosphoenolpyruvate synthase [Candidatus Lokiarchaeota archaeon]|nr:phosphoenolpyruvate synthase [Candidatus Lokiarchaeota archaeon]